MSQILKIPDALFLCAFMCISGCYLDVDPPSSVGADASFDGATPGDTAGVPCDVAKVFSTYCLGCHEPTSGLPRLDSAAALKGASSQMGLSVAELALQKLRDVQNPMPPKQVSLRPQMADIDLIAQWVSDGYPEGQCGTADSPDAGDNPFQSPPQCSSARMVAENKRDKERMNPGRACISCHSQQEPDEDEVPNLVVAGTLYPTAHEPNQCVGVNGPKLDAVVIITGADGQTFHLPVNQAGNFLLPQSAGLKFPFTAKVVSQGRERKMQTPQNTGDCNSCHTQAGTNKAPGRVLLP